MLLFCGVSPLTLALSPPRGEGSPCAGRFQNSAVKNSSSNRLSLLPVLIGAVLLLLVPLFWSQQLNRHLTRPAFVTGWWLFAVMLFLGAFNARKKISTLPLGNASTWLRWHVTGGFLTLALFWLHTRTLWPTGL